MQEKRKRLIMLHHIRSITRPLLRSMLQKDATLKSFFEMSPKQLSNELKIPFNRSKAIYESLRNEKSWYHYHNNLKNIHVITIFDNDYPDLLKHIYDYPLVLYGIGNKQLLHHYPSISVVGTRQPSPHGPQKLHFVVTPLVHLNWTIVSGLAYGIDRLAHEIALQYNGNTIAVLGSGFHHVYPREHEPLFKQIATKGLIISEYPPHIKPEKYHFPERNRIVSGLSNATLVIEAKEKSGTYITVDHALDQGKDVYVVPGSIFYPQTKGCHKMIQEGAKLVTSAQDILEDFPIKCVK